MASPQERKFAFSYLERGKEFAAAKQYPEALEALREAVRRDPAMVEAWTLLASVHYTLGEDIECLGATEEALKHSANSGAAWNLRGVALERIKRYEEALRAYDSAMRVDGWFLQAAPNTFRTLTKLDRYDEALRIADALLDARRDSGLYWSMRAAALRCLQQYEQAYQAARTAARLDPEEGYAWWQLAAVLCHKHQYVEAFTAIERDLRLRGESSDFWRLKAEILTGQRRFEDAFGASQRALALDSESTPNLNRIGLALLYLGRPAEAYKHFVQAIALCAQATTVRSQDSIYPCNAGAALADLRWYEDALVWTDRALALHPQFVTGIINRADCLVHVLRYEEAEAQLADPSAGVAEHSEYWAVKGSLHTRRGEYDEALAAIKHAIDLRDDDGGTAVAWEYMGELLIALEDYTKALVVAEHGLDLRPYSRGLLELKAKALRGLGRESEAEEIERAVEARLAEQLALLDQMESTSA